MFSVGHFRNTTVHTRLLLERVRSPEGSTEKFHAGRRVFPESALRHLRPHHLSLSFLSLSFPFFSLYLFPSLPFTIPLFNLQSTAKAARRNGGIGAKDGFRYRKDREQDFPSYIPAASYPEIRMYSVTDRFERASVKVTPSRVYDVYDVYFLINLHGAVTLYSLAHISGKESASRILLQAAERIQRGWK